MVKIEIVIMDNNTQLVQKIGSRITEELLNRERAAYRGSISAYNLTSIKLLALENRFKELLK